MSMKIVTQALTEPVGIDLVKRQARFVNPKDDALLELCAIAARELCESYLSQALCIAQFEWTLDRFINLYFYQTALWTQQVWPWNFQSQSLLENKMPNTWQALWIPIVPVVSVDQIRYIDVNGVWQTLDPSQYIFDSGGPTARIEPAWGQYWPPTQMRIGAVKVTFTAGQQNVKAKHKLAILQLAAYWYDQHEAASDVNMTEIPLNFQALLGPPCGGRYITP